MSEASKPTHDMEYRKMGNTALKLSVLGFGMMTADSVELVTELLEVARAHGCNFFDNAELYGDPRGNSERIFGKALKECQKKNPDLWRRSDIVITTKLCYGVADGKQKQAPTWQSVYGENESGLSAKHLREGMDSALERLGLSYVDIVYAHRPDPLAPMEEVVRGFNDIINRGQALYWGTSCFSAQQLTEAYYIAKMLNLRPPVVEQPLYNMFARETMERDLKPMFRQPYCIGTTTFSPLDSGILTGKYNTDNPPKDTRLTDGDSLLGKWFVAAFQALELAKKEKIGKVEKLLPIATKLGCKMPHLALGWCLKNANVTSVILGATKVQQLEDNFKALEVARKLTNEDMLAIEEIIAMPKQFSMPQIRKLTTKIQTWEPPQ